MSSKVPKVPFSWTKTGDFGLKVQYSEFLKKSKEYFYTIQLFEKYRSIPKNREKSIVLCIVYTCIEYTKGL